MKNLLLVFWSKYVITTLVMLLVILRVISMTDARKIESPQNEIKKKGSFVAWLCVFEATTCATISWEYDDVRIYFPEEGFIGPLKNMEQRASIHNTTDGGRCTSKLNITDLQLADTGKFSCAGITDKNVFMKHSELLVVDYPEKCQVNDSNGIVEHESLLIGCSVTYGGSKSPKLSIQNLQNQILSKEAQKIGSNKLHVLYTLVASVPRVQSYICVVEHNPSNSDTNFASNNPTLEICRTNEMQVMYPPRNIRIDPPGISRLEPPGTSFEPETEVTCSADGYPLPDIRWDDVSTGNQNVLGGSTLTNICRGEGGRSSNSKFVCVAGNTIRGRLFKINSPEITFDGTKSTEISFTIDTGSASSSSIIIGILVTIIFIESVAFVSYVLIQRTKSKDLSPEVSSPAVELSAIQQTETDEQKKERFEVVYEDVRNNSTQNVSEENENSDAAMYASLSIDDEIDYHMYSKLRLKAPKPTRVKKTK